MSESLTQKWRLAELRADQNMAQVEALLAEQSRQHAAIQQLIGQWRKTAESYATLSEGTHQREMAIVADTREQCADELEVIAIVQAFR